MNFNRLGIIFVFLLASINIEAQSLSQQKVKAAYLYNIMKFVHWEEKTKLDVCVLGKNPFGGYLNQLKQRRIGDLSIETTQSSHVKGLEHCSLIYVSDISFEGVAKYLEGRGILTLGESDKFLDQGGMIQFLIKDGKLRMNIHFKNLDKENISVSSKLLRSSIVTIYGN